MHVIAKLLNAFLPQSSITIRLHPTDVGKLVSEMSENELALFYASYQGELIYRTDAQRKIIRKKSLNFSYEMKLASRVKFSTPTKIKAKGK